MFLIAWIQIIWLRITKRGIYIPKNTWIKFEKQNIYAQLQNPVAYSVCNLRDGDYVCLLNSLRRSICKFIPLVIFDQKKETEQYFSFPVAWVRVKNGRVVFYRTASKIKMEITEEELNEIEATRK